MTLSGPNWRSFKAGRVIRCELRAFSTYAQIQKRKEADTMEIKCLSFGHSVNLDHVVFQNYFGTVKCFTCSSKPEVKTKEGVLLDASLLVPRLYLKVRQKEARNTI